ncbi:MAG: HipA N-terminal domain-containing protein [Bacteroidetes bacterium]|nr:HipA N-terminal domain-containing protein [Bacteroidota bacterium]
MRQAKVLFKDEEAGLLSQHDDGSFTFQYHDYWIANISKPSISLSLPKAQRAFTSKSLFPFFFHLLPEGSNKQVACTLNRIDQEDYFGLLMATAKHDSIGAVRIIKLEQA